MRHLEIDLEEWQERLLDRMARNNGLPADAMAKALLSDDLFRQAYRGLGGPPVVDSAVQRDTEQVNPDTIEARLRRLFEV